MATHESRFVDALFSILETWVEQEGHVPPDHAVEVVTETTKAFFEMED
jgi:hypothetical protein